MAKKQPSDETPLPANKPRVTLRDIGKETGFSHVTVSRALRNGPGISERTKILIKEKANEMGYSPDPMLNALANYRLANQEKPIQATLAWINLFENPEELRGYNVFDQYWNGANDAARQFGFRLEEFRWADLSFQRMNDIFKARNIRGIILSPSSYTDADLHPQLDAFPWQYYATVRFGQSTQSLNVNFISSAQVSNTITAFEQIKSKGYKRIGFVGKYFFKFLFSAGYLWAQQAIPEKQRLPPLFFQENDHLEELKKMLTPWMKATKPDAIICDNPHLPQLLEELGYRIPEEVGLCALSINDTNIDAGIDQNPEEIGRAAVRSLVSQLHENAYGIPQHQSEILVKGQWVDGSMLPDRR